MANITQLKVNPENLVKHLRFGFTRSTTTLGELMQNARRTGASRVTFDYTAEFRTLQVCDDGCGIGHLQTLLTVAESGWDAELIEREHAFGLGFLLAIFACQYLTVESRGGRISVPTAELLAFQPVVIEPVDDWDGITRITLRDFKPAADQVEFHLRRLARGFPIPVLFNGDELKRPEALDAGLDFIETEIGPIYLKGFGQDENWLDSTDGFALYLQGLPVFESSRDHSFGNIVHLDSARFHARLPDRDRLIDEDDVLAQVKDILQREARRKIETLKKDLDPVELAEGYDTLQSWGCLDLLNDVPVIPKRVLSSVPDYPIREGCCPFNLGVAKQVVTREAVASGQVVIADLDDFDSAGAARWMVAWHKELLVYRRPLHERHWLFGYLRDLNAETVRVDWFGETHRAWFDGEWVCGEAVFCEQYRLSVGDDFIDIDAESLYDEERGLFIVPRGDASGLVVGQASSYHDEWDSFNASVKETDEWTFHTRGGQYLG